MGKIAYIWVQIVTIHDVISVSEIRHVSLGPLFETQQGICSKNVEMSGRSSRLPCYVCFALNHPTEKFPVVPRCVIGIPFKPLPFRWSADPVISTIAIHQVTMTNAFAPGNSCKDILTPCQCSSFSWCSKITDLYSSVTLIMKCPFCRLLKM